MALELVLTISAPLITLVCAALWGGYVGSGAPARGKGRGPSDLRTW